MTDVSHLPADEALFLGAALAHVAQYRERQRLARIAQQSREIARGWRR